MIWIQCHMVRDFGGCIPIRRLHLNAWRLANESTPMSELQDLWQLNGNHVWPPFTKTLSCRLMDLTGFAVPQAEGIILTSIFANVSLLIFDLIKVFTPEESHLLQISSLTEACQMLYEHQQDPNLIQAELQQQYDTINQFLINWYYPQQ